MPPLPLYFDEAATTSLHPAARDAMLPWLGIPANAHARHHAFGARAAAAVARARAQVAAMIGAAPDTINFTSGATEANNMFIAGIAPLLRAAGKTHIITSAVEHNSILQPLAALDGFTVTVLPVKPCAMIEADMIARAITPQTGLVTVQSVNNITGTIQPLAEIAAMLAGRDIILHADAAQAPGKIPLSAHGVDAMTLSAHKLYGPQGIGALYLRPGLALTPLLHGGGQENGLRAGTLPVALCAGFGAACDVLADDRLRLQALRDRIIQDLAAFKPEIFGHSDPAWNVPGILCLRFPGIDHETLTMAMPDIAFGVGSACGGPNHVVAAIAGPVAATEAIRLSFGKFTTADQVHQATAMIAKTVTFIRAQQEAA